jgi:predicted anti-sigma-YlaC factor YlaD
MNAAAAAWLPVLAWSAHRVICASSAAVVATAGQRSRTGSPARARHGGNYGRRLSDNDGVECERCREALSARLDGEDEPDERVGVDAHLADCRDCGRWWEDAAAVTRLARTGPAVPGVDVTAAVLATAPGRGKLRLAVALRVVLGVLGAAQLFLGLVQVAALASAGEHVHDVAVGGGASPNHLWHESAAWNVAVGAGFLWAAGRRGRPVGIVPVLTAFVAMLGLLSAGDVLAGRVEGLRLASHGLVLAGYLIVVALTRPTLSFDDPPGSGVSTRSRWQAAFDDDEDTGGFAAPQPGRGDLDGRPAAHEQRRHAA